MNYKPWPTDLVPQRRSPISRLSLWTIHRIAFLRVDMLAQSPQQMFYLIKLVSHFLDMTVGSILHQH
jgi:hypothetical protein